MIFCSWSCGMPASSRFGLPPDLTGVERIHKRHCGHGDRSAVVVTQAANVVDDISSNKVVTHTEEVREAFEDGHSFCGDRAFHCITQVGGQAPMNISGKDDATFNVFLLLGSLLRHLLDNALVHVAIQLVNGDISVAVDVGLASHQPLRRGNG